MTTTTKRQMYRGMRHAGYQRRDAFIAVFGRAPESNPIKRQRINAGEWVPRTSKRFVRGPFMGVPESMMRTPAEQTMDERRVAITDAMRAMRML